MMNVFVILVLEVKIVRHMYTPPSTTRYYYLVQIAMFKVWKLSHSNRTIIIIVQPPQPLNPHDASNHLVASLKNDLISYT